MNDELHDIADPSPHLPGMYVPWYLWLILGFVLIAFLVLAITLWRRKAATPPDIAGVYEESRKQLEALRGVINDHPLAHIATEASFAVRRYLAAYLSEPALFETHEEFILRKNSLARLPTGSRDRLNPLLEQLATLKYSPSQSDPESADTVLMKSLNTLQGIESTRDKELAP
jgi:hypothetical protein